VTGNLLITGRPASGKTTLIRRLAERLSDLDPVGFYTTEIREHGRRVGFELVSLHGKRQALAYFDIRSPYRVSRYGVDIERFETFLASVPFSASGTRLVIIDEIGKMECFSERFRGIVREVLDSDTPCLATIAAKGVPGIEQIKARGDVRLIEVTRTNRDELVPALEIEVRHLQRRRDPEGGNNLQ
jgi:nucleoside-triphosphatase